MATKVYFADTAFKDYAAELSGYGRRLLAEGDSWFTIGTLRPSDLTNILFCANFSTSTAIVSCAYPGDTLKRMVDSVNDPWFDRYLRKPRFASYWEAILLSAGGNDLIDAAQVRPFDTLGALRPLNARLLLTVEEAQARDASVVGGERYISEPGWAQLHGYLLANMATLVQRRETGPSRGRPIFLHTYGTPTARCSGTVLSPEGWLWPALQAYRIPQAEQQAVTLTLFSRLRALLLSLDSQSGSAHALPHVRVFDSAGTLVLAPAAAGATGVSGDWVNEIHLTRRGYQKFGAAFGAWAEQILRSYP